MAHLLRQILSADMTRTSSLYEEPPSGYCQWHYRKRECGATDEQMNTEVNIKAKMENGVCVSVSVCVIDDGRLKGELLQLSCSKLVRTDAITLTADTRPSITVTQSSHGRRLQIAVSVREGVCVCKATTTTKETLSQWWHQWAKLHNYETYFDVIEMKVWIWNMLQGLLMCQQQIQQEC